MAQEQDMKQTRKKHGAGFKAKVALAAKLCASSSANWCHGTGCRLVHVNSASLCSIECDDPFVPTSPVAEHRAQWSQGWRRESAAPAEPARSVLDRASPVLG